MRVANARGKQQWSAPIERGEREMIAVNACFKCMRALFENEMRAEKKTRDKFTLKMRDANARGKQQLCAAIVCSEREMRAENVSVKCDR